MKADGSKAPAVGSWKEYQDTPASDEQIGEWFRSQRRGLGIVTGVGGIELLEFEDDVSFTRWCRDMVRAGLADELRATCGGYLARTPGRGYHLIYRTDQPQGNLKLARTEPGKGISRYMEWTGENDFVVKTSEVLIETRGVGGFVVVAGGAAAVHPAGRPYRRIRLPESFLVERMQVTVVEDDGTDDTYVSTRRDLSPAPDHLHFVSVEVRDEMFALARQQDRRTLTAKSERRVELGGSVGQGMLGVRPGDAWAAVTTWDEILEPHGWRRDHSTDQSDRWTRPGKASGTSATTNYAGSGLLYVFSSSTEFETGDDETYTKFGAYAVLNHDGDHEAAARHLVARGFADPMRAEADAREQLVVQRAIEREIYLDADEMARRNRASRDMRIPITRTMIEALESPLPDPAQLIEGLVIGEGVTLLSAQNKTGKSTVGLNVVRAVLHGERLFGAYPTHLPDDGGVGIWNAEVSASTYERWLREHGIDPEPAKRLAMLHMTGYTVDVLAPAWHELAVRWLREHNVKLWVLDPLSKIFRGDENSATEVNAWWMGIRAIMAEADVPAAFVIHHAGHTDDDRRARARGSSAIEGDPEVVLSYRHGGKPGNFPPDNKRYLSGVGRIDGIPSVTLDYDPSTRRLFVDGDSQGFAADRQVHEDEAIASAAWALLDGAEAHHDDSGLWISKQQIKDADTGLGDRKALAAIERCVARGYLAVEQTPNGKPDKVRRGPCTRLGRVEVSVESEE
ncbi:MULTISPECIES: AAA family ATPase [unclassified Gordonia (in: high G+C Gram-positive bacteria)]|uniref:AAA family ATPase n=1 Tax=unclassified Gordonia (in: high G+C Gram-positive bacteria) TaxID=2657482 RepID=UPI0011167EE3|nr:MULTISPECIES: AAA family ATPase [unclassified Gordonia (in: high G+C Gram-positive bacteria)]MCX2756597.1 AAA family ATPase [Gordonia sp. 4N]